MCKNKLRHKSYSHKEEASWKQLVFKSIRKRSNCKLTILTLVIMGKIHVQKINFTHFFGLRLKKNKTEMNLHGTNEEFFCKSKLDVSTYLPAPSMCSLNNMLYFISIGQTRILQFRFFSV